jgi:hypothetical protein
MPQPNRSRSKIPRNSVLLNHSKERYDTKASHLVLGVHLTQPIDQKNHLREASLTVRRAIRYLNILPGLGDVHSTLATDRLCLTTAPVLSSHRNGKMSKAQKPGLSHIPSQFHFQIAITRSLTTLSFHISFTYSSLPGQCPRSPASRCLPGSSLISRSSGRASTAVLATPIRMSDESCRVGTFLLSDQTTDHLSTDTTNIRMSVPILPSEM